MRNWRDANRAEVELWASTARLASGQGNDQVGEARAELLRRDQEYAEAQELSRREYEDDRAATRREFEERLMQRQMEHASRTR